MPRFALRLALLVALAGLPAEARGQGVTLWGGDVDLVIPVAGGGFGTAVDESTRIEWEPSPDDKMKVTVETLATSQAFDLVVEAVAVAEGQSAGPVPLTVGMFPRDVVLNIKKGKKPKRQVPGSARLRYEASVPAGASPAAGVDDHTVLYTITAQ